MRVFERQEGESAKAYAAFSLYRDLGAAERSLTTVSKALYGVRWKYGKRTVEKWSSSFDWVARVQAFDDSQEMIRLEAIEQYEQDQGSEFARRVQALHELNFANEERAAELETRFLERIERLLDELPLITETRVEEDEDGNAVTYVLKPATKNSVLDAARLHNIATRSEPDRVDITSDGEEIQIIEYTYEPKKEEGECD